MALQQKLAMRQGQSLVMTPQLSQSIKLLALSNIELAAFVEQEVEKNPFLESDMPDDREQRAQLAAMDEAEASGPLRKDNENIADLANSFELETSARSLSENIGTSLENVYPDEPDFERKTAENCLTRETRGDSIAPGGLQLSTQGSSHDQEVADFTAKSETLRDHLGGQLALSGATMQINAIVSDMIENLDDAGYLRADLGFFCERLGCCEEDAQSALALLQSFEPTGIGSRDLAECLTLQLREKNRFDPAMAVIVSNLDLLAKRDFASLKRLSGLEIDDLHDALREIRTLDPKPGTMFEASPVQHVVPDVFVSEAQDGSWAIELNNETLPRVLLNNSYATQVSRRLKSGADKEFLSDCLQTANWLTRSLDQRAQTILKVAREIVKQQDAFFVHGVHHLRPLTLRMVADEIDMHESSVSRVTSNKYMLTPRGLFELKYFFTTGIASTETGDAHSSEAVRQRIRSLIDAETASSVLSDDAIVDALKSAGIDIARRTIAKYRDAMHIPSSVQRRREMKAREMAELSA